MDQEDNILSATRKMNMPAIKQCIADHPECINSVDENKNNLMHICVAGGASIRARHIMEFFLNETTIDLLQENINGEDVLDLAISLNDQESCEMIEPFWNRQLNNRFPLDQTSSLAGAPIAAISTGPKLKL